MREPQLKEILNKLDVQRVVRDGKWIRAECPFAEFYHDRGTDRSPSFFVSVSATELSGFGCFTCKEHGRISSLVRKLEHLRKEQYPGLAMEADLSETPDSFEDYERDFDAEPDPEPLNKSAYMTMYPPAWNHADSRNYLISREISGQTTDLLQLQYDDEENRVLFPVFDYKGDLYGFSGRSVLTDEAIDKRHELRIAAGHPRGYKKVRDYTGLPKERLLLGEHLIEGDKPLWIVEGLFAFAWMVELGVREICNPVATMGSRLTKYQRDLVVGYNRSVYLVYDNDAAGEMGIYGREGHREDGALLMLKDHVPTFVAMYPEGKNDPDTLTFDDVREMIEEPE